jgi:Xaa-Pro aminopeptidase
VDPVDIRYLSGTSTTPVWTLHVIDRHLLVPAEGEPVLWERASAPADLVSPYPHLRRRTATSWSVSGSAERPPGRAARFAAELADVLQEWGIRDARIGVDRLDAYGFLALQDTGVHLEPAQLAVERLVP